MALDLTNVNTPGAVASGSIPTPSAPIVPAPDVMTPPMAQPNVTVAPDTGINPQVAPAPPKGGTPIGTPNLPPHARLAAMVQGLADGLSGFSQSMATKGKISGADVVQNLEGQRQQQAQSAQAAATAAKNADLQHQLMAASLAEKQMNNTLLLHTLPNDMTESDTKRQAGQLGVIGQTQDLRTKALQDFTLTGDMAAYNDTLAKLGSASNAGTVPTAGGPAGAAAAGAPAVSIPPVAVATWKNSVDSAVSAYPNDPTIKQYAAILVDPKSTPQQMAMAANGAKNRMSSLDAGAESRTKQEAANTNAPFGAKADALNAAMTERYQVLNPGKSLPSNLAMSADSTPKDFDRADKILQQTENASATKANRDIVNGMREQMLDLAKGAQIPGDETKTGAEYIATLPVGLQGTVTAIGTGRAAPPPAGSRSPAAQSILGALNRAYPDYDATKYPSYLDARKKFTSGPEGKGINAINTVTTHLAKMYDHAMAPGTSGGITGKVTGFFGDKDVRALDVDRTAVSTELSKAYAAGQISEGEVKDWENKLDFTKPGMTTGKLITNLKEIDSLLEGKQKAYEQQWSTAAPSASIVSPVPIISPEAASARAIIRGQAAAPAAPTGATGKGKAADGNWYYHDAQGNNLGLVK